MMMATRNRSTIPAIQTMDNHFNDLHQFSYAPNYIRVNPGNLRLHYLDEGEYEGEPVLMMHGEPTWCYLWRNVIPEVAKHGHRVICPDLIGFGKSDKPTSQMDLSYEQHVDWMSSFLENMHLDKITLVCHDWGGLIGLRLVARYPEKFRRVLASNTGLPTGDEELPKAFLKWQQFARNAPSLEMGEVVQKGTVTYLSDEVMKAYDAPFPTVDYQSAPRKMPSLVPTMPDDPSSAQNRRAWEVLKKFRKPFMTAFSDSDPITRGLDLRFQAVIPGAQGLNHRIIKNAGHFLQEDNPGELAQAIVDFINETQ